MNDKRNNEDNDRQNSSTDNNQDRESKNPFKEPVQANPTEEDDADLEQQRKEALTERD
jgi:hypothetical protein